MLCLTSGSITVLVEGSEPANYAAPDCYMMPAYTKVSVLTLETKDELALLRVPEGGLDWVVLEEAYYGLQGQWA